MFCLGQPLFGARPQLPLSTRTKAQTFEVKACNIPLHGRGMSAGDTGSASFETRRKAEEGKA